MTDRDRELFEEWRAGRIVELRAHTDWDVWQAATTRERNRLRIAFDACAKKNGINGLEDRERMYRQAAFLA
ncbi:MAG: hypothetical protein E4H01_11890, partial [Lysobacterales bacterium]